MTLERAASYRSRKGEGNSWNFAPSSPISPRVAISFPQAGSILKSGDSQRTNHWTRNLGLQVSMCLSFLRKHLLARSPLNHLKESWRKEDQLIAVGLREQHGWREKSSDTDDLLGEFYHTFKEELSLLHMLVRVGDFQHTLLSWHNYDTKIWQEHQGKENFKPMFS